MERESDVIDNDSIEFEAMRTFTSDTRKYVQSENTAELVRAEEQRCVRLCAKLDGLLLQIEAGSNDKWLSGIRYSALASMNNRLTALTQGISLLISRLRKMEE